MHGLFLRDVLDLGVVEDNYLDGQLLPERRGEVGHELAEVPIAVDADHLPDLNAEMVSLIRSSISSGEGFSSAAV